MTPRDQQISDNRRDTQRCSELRCPRRVTLAHNPFLALLFRGRRGGHKWEFTGCVSEPRALANRSRRFGLEFRVYAALSTCRLKAELRTKSHSPLIRPLNNMINIAPPTIKRYPINTPVVCVFRKRSRNQIDA